MAKPKVCWFKCYWWSAAESGGAGRRGRSSKGPVGHMQTQPLVDSSKLTEPAIEGQISRYAWGSVSLGKEPCNTFGMIMMGLQRALCELNTYIARLSNESDGGIRYYCYNFQNHTTNKFDNCIINWLWTMKQTQRKPQTLRSLIHHDHLNFVVRIWNIL